MFFRDIFRDYLDSRYSFRNKYKAAREGFISQGKPEKWFEDLHLAAALNMPDVCLSLLEAGANSNHKCPYGTPLDLALRGILALMPWDSAWSEDERQDAGWGNHSTYRNVIDYMVPAASQRNRTIEILIQAGSKLSHDKSPALDLGKESIFSTVSIIACHTRNFTPVIQLLSLGIIPSDSELDALEAYFRHWMFQRDSEADSQVRDGALLELLQYLDSAGVYDSVWGLRMGSVVWGVASALGSAFTKETNLGNIDTRISLSKDGLVHKAQAAISRDDSKTFQMCLDDKRLDTSQAHVTEAGAEMTLVQFATGYNAVKCLEVLLEFGLNEEHHYTSGPSPIPLVHVCIQAKAIGSLRVLVDHGISPLTADPNGMTIFHRCVSEFDDLDVNLIRDILALDPHATAAGLAMRTSKGETPLDFLLLEFRCARESEEMAIELMDWCDKIPGFWSDNHQLFKNAAAFGSAPVIRRLLDLGAKPDPLDSSNIHQIQAHVTLECVRLLKSLYGEPACELRTEPSKYLPVELYILRCMEDAIRPDEAIVHELLTPGVIHPKDLTLGTPWTFCCEILPHGVRRWTKNVEMAYLGSENRLMTQVLAMLLRLGCMHGYEETWSQSALIPFINGVLDGFGSYYYGGATLTIRPNEPGDIMQLVFDSTKYLDAAKTSPTTIRLLKQAIKDGHNQLVSFLLCRGVDVHQRQDKYSAIEFICREPGIMTNHATTERKAMIMEILDMMNHEKLNEAEPSGDGLGLLHMITACAEPGPAWLMSELVKRGVDIDKESVSRQTPLLFHLKSKSFDSARRLVELGASYGNRIDTKNQMDAIQLAAEQGAHDFLRFLLAHSVQNSVDIAWDRTYEDTYLCDTRDITHGGITALHLAAEGGHVECLQLFFDKKDFKEFEPRTSYGWTPLHFAAWNNCPEVIEFLISKGADIQALANDKSSPLHIAVREGNISSTKTLLRLGATNLRDSKAMTPRQYAIKNGYREIAVYLDEAFAPQMRAIPDTIPWHGTKRVLQRLEIAVNDDDIDECRRLYNLGCPLDASMHTCHGCSPLIASLRANSTNVARWLLEHGVSTLKMDCSDEGFHVTELAAKMKKATTVLPQILERNHDEGADWVSEKEYPLHFAVDSKNFAAAELILQHIDGRKADIG
jgi:ankyrin repeat protein